MDVSGPPPSTPPPIHMWKYHVAFYHSLSRVPLIRTLDSDLQLRKQPALVFFFFFSGFFRGLRPVAHIGLHPMPLLAGFYWKQSEVFVFTALLGMRDGGYLGLPLSRASEMRAEEKLPSAHNGLANTPRAKASQLADLGFQPQLFFS